MFFNARFYYPVFTILFLDFGLTLEQFALLNVAWAVTIVLLEAPSGALADTIGRRNLLVCAGVFMVVEMALLCFAPKGNPHLLFAIFLVNRVLSGAAEASASGADEALAYDSLKEEGDTNDWGRVLEKQMRFQSMGFIAAMSLGGAVYDPDLMGRLARWFGLKQALTQDMTLRFPLILTLAMAVMALLTTLRMKEVVTREDRESLSYKNWGESITQALRLTLQAGRWILKTPFALVIITTGLIFDHIIRMIMTVSSQYFRLIALPEATFGLIGSGLAVLGLFIPLIALRLVETRTPMFNLGIMIALAFVGLEGMTLFHPIVGLLPMVLLYSVIFLLGFFISHYLNRITSSNQRATILSLKGLSLNLAYGFIGLSYSFLLAMIRSQVLETKLDLGGQNIENVVFVHSLAWFPWYFILALIVLMAFARWQLRHSDQHKRIG